MISKGGLKSSEIHLGGVWGEARRNIPPATASTFAIEATSALFVSRNANEGVPMSRRSISYFKVPHKYSKMLVKMKLLPNNHAVLGQCIFLGNLILTSLLNEEVS